MRVVDARFLVAMGESISRREVSGTLKEEFQLSC